MIIATVVVSHSSSHSHGTSSLGGFPRLRLILVVRAEEADTHNPITLT